MSTFRFCFIEVMLILIAFVGTGQVKAQEATAMGPASDDSKSRWTPPPVDQVKAVNSQLNVPAKVRIGLRLTPFKKVVTRHPDGSTETQYIAAEALRHTLRARLNQANHFYVGEWHVVTAPVKWVQKTRHYEVQLQLNRRYGAFGQLEENVGSVLLSGVLEEQEDHVHVLIGAVRQRLRDKFGNPYLDVVAGSQAAPQPSAQAAPAAASPHKAASAQMGTPAATGQGRF